MHSSPFINKRFSPCLALPHRAFNRPFLHRRAAPLQRVFRSLAVIWVNGGALQLVDLPLRQERIGGRNLIT